MQNPNTADRLRRKVRRDAALQALFALAAVGIGVLILQITFWIVQGVIWMGFRSFIELKPSVVRWVARGFIVLLFVSSVRSSVDYLSQYSRRDRTTVDRSVAAEISNIAKLITILLFIGPRFITRSVGCWLQARRLLKVDVQSCSSVLALLLAADAAVPLSDIARQLPNIDMERTTAHLHAIGGMLFLVGPPPALGLGTPLKHEMTDRR
jgi:hypothetical protein